MKRVLIISYFFPPASNMGSHRILRFVRHLRECDWEPVVLASTLEGWPQTDARLLEEVPTDIEVRRVSGVDLTAVWKKFTRRGETRAPAVATAPTSQGYGLTTFLNRWVMIPDKFFPWISPAARTGEELVREKGITAIFSTSDPLSDHLVALRIARRTGVPFIAEFRDLWLGNPYFSRAHPTPLHRAWHARLERSVVNRAAVVVGLSRGIADYFQRNYQKPVRVIYNCFQPEDYAGAVAPSAKFSVLYAGAVYSSRSPEPFFAGFARFVQRHGLSPAQAEIVWLGESPDLDLRGMAKRLDVAAFVRFEGRVAHAEALRRMQSATMLLTLQSPDDAIHVPGKLFEYVGARRPIFAVARPCEVADIIRQYGLGWVAEPEAEAVSARLTEVYAAWKGNNHVGVETQAIRTVHTRIVRRP